MESQTEADYYSQPGTSPESNNWEQEYAKRFADFIGSSLWYTPVREFIRRELEKAREEATVKETARMLSSFGSRLDEHNKKIREEGRQEGYEQGILSVAVPGTLIPRQRILRLIEKMEVEKGIWCKECSNNWKETLKNKINDTRT